MNTTVKDPVCGMTVNENTPLRVVHQGTSYYFCSDKCRREFEANPAAFAPPVAPPCEPAPHTRGMTMNWAAPFYDLYCRAVGLGLSFRNQTLRAAKIQPDERLLDVGCGTGVLTRLALDAAGSAASAVGIDPAPDMIRVAREHAKQLGSRAEFRVAAIENLPFPDSSFDVALASLMLHHLPPDARLEGLREVHRVLKPGGRLVVADFGRPTNPLWWLVAWPFLFLPMTADNLRGRIPAYLREAGFDPVEMVGHRAGLLMYCVARKPGAAK